MKSRAWIAFIGSFLPLAPAGAAPLAVSYQGLLTDAEGAPMNGTTSFVFRIYAAPTGGTPLYTETFSGVLVVDGVNAVQLGSIAALPASLFDGSERYLEVTANSELMSPRQRMTSVPYALTAARVEQPAIPSISALAGLPCNAANPLAGNLVITYAPNGAVTLTCSQLFSLTVSTVGGSNPATPSSPPGILCDSGPSDCSEAYVGGTTVTLTTGNNGSHRFAAWTGACTGTGSCVLLMDANKSVIAHYSLN